MYKVIHFVDESLKKDAYLRTYSETICPIPDQCNWPSVDKPVLLPPVKHVKIGRPKHNRKRERNEGPARKKRYTLTCSQCNKLGHNKRSCPLNKENTITNSSSSKTYPSARQLSGGEIQFGPSGSQPNAKRQKHQRTNVGSSPGIAKQAAKISTRYIQSQPNPMRQKQKGKIRVSLTQPSQT